MLARDFVQLTRVSSHTVTVYFYKHQHSITIIVRYFHFNCDYLHK